MIHKRHAASSNDHLSSFHSQNNLGTRWRTKLGHELSKEFLFLLKLPFIRDSAFISCPMEKLRKNSCKKIIGQVTYACYRVRFKKKKEREKAVATLRWLTLRICDLKEIYAMIKLRHSVFFACCAEYCTFSVPPPPPPSSLSVSCIYDAISVKKTRCARARLSSS